MITNSPWSDVAVSYFKAADEYSAKTGKRLTIMSFLNGEY